MTSNESDPGPAKEDTCLRILSMDPGTVNWAWTLWAGNRLEDHGWVTPLYKVGQEAEFLNDFIELLIHTRPDIVIAERFMVRNRGQSVHAEVISQALGMISVLCKVVWPAEFMQITSAQWKNWRMKQKGTLVPALESVHLSDAAWMGVYLRDYWLEKAQKKQRTS